MVTDASDYVGGTVSFQNSDGTHHAFEFTSKQLDAHQRDWYCSEKEVFPVVFALEKWKRGPLQNKFIAYTDHRDLIELMTNRNIIKLYGWLVRLQPFLIRDQIDC